MCYCLVSFFAEVKIFRFWPKTMVYIIIVSRFDSNSLQGLLITVGRCVLWVLNGGLWMTVKLAALR